MSRPFLPVTELPMIESSATKKPAIATIHRLYEKQNTANLSGHRRIPAFYPFCDNRHCIVRVQAFQVIHPHPEILVRSLFVERLLDLAGGVFTEHQVLAVQTGE